jgi:hypothetical protein
MWVDPNSVKIQYAHSHRQLVIYENAQALQEGLISSVTKLRLGGRNTLSPVVSFTPAANEPCRNSEIEFHNGISGALVTTNCE